jgi:hypothetical protein
MGLKWSKYIGTGDYENLFHVNLIVAFGRQDE